MIYKKELEVIAEELKDKIDKQFKKWEVQHSSNPEWIEEYNKLNLLRVDLATVKSRIEKLDRADIRTEVQTPKM